MRLVTYSVDHEIIGPGLVVDDRVVAVKAIWQAVLAEPFPGWPLAYSGLHENWHRFEQAAGERASTPITEVGLHAPVIRPGKILCVGLNYRDHVEEVGLKAPQRPHVFSKLSTALNDPNGPVVVPWDVTSEVDYEAELAMVIGRRASRVDPGSALEYILGWTVVNDISARDWQFAPDDQLTLGKGFDGFMPIGPWVVSPHVIGDAADLRVRCWVDDELRQDASTAEMVTGPQEIVSFLSQVCTLEPGDVIATGTPAGVGFGRKPQRFLETGQVVRTEIEGIGSLTNEIK